MSTRQDSIDFDVADWFDSETPFGLAPVYKATIGGEDADWFDPDLNPFGLEDYVAPAAFVSTDASLLELTLLLTSNYNGLPWVGLASLGTSLGHDFTSPVFLQAATLALTSFLRGGLATTPFPGAASAGPSGARAWSNGLSPPSAGAGLNSFDTRRFDNTLGQFVTADGVASDYISASASSGWLVINTAILLADGANPQSNDPVLVDSGGYYGIATSIGTTSNAGAPWVGFFIVTGGVVLYAKVDIDANQWLIIQWRHTGTTVEIRAGSAGSGVMGAWNVVDHIGVNFVGNVDAGFAGQFLNMGVGVGGAQFADYDFADGGIIDSALTYAQMDGLVLEVQERFLTYLGLLDAPDSAAGPNGSYNVADFARSFSGLKYSTGTTYLSDLLGVPSFFFSIMFNARTAPADAGAGNRYAGALLFGDQNENLLLTLSVNGLAAVMYDVSTGWADVQIACSLSAWHYAQVWHDGARLWLQVDAGTPQSVAVPIEWFATYFTLMIPCLGGRGFLTGGYRFDGQIQLLTARKGYPNYLQRYDIALGFQDRYSVDFGFAAAVTVTGSGAMTMASYAVAGSGTVQFIGTSAITCASYAVAASGTETFTGTCAITVASCAVAAAGTEQFLGTCAIAAPAYSCSAAGSLVFTGTGACTCPAYSCSATGALVFTGTCAVTTPAFSCAASGLLSFVGTGSCALSPYSCSATGAETFSGTCAIAASAYTVAAAGEQRFTGTAAITAPVYALAASGTYTPQAITGTAAIDLSPLAVAALGALSFDGSAAISLAALAVNAAGTETFTGAAAITIASYQPSAVGTYTAIPISGTGALLLSPYAVAASGEQVFAGAAAIALSSLSLDAAGALRFEGSAALLLAALALSANGGESFEGTAAINLARLALAAAGSNAWVYRGDLAITISGFSVDGTGEQRFEGAAALAQASLSVDAAGAISFEGAAAIELARLALAAVGAYTPVPITGTGAIELPAYALAASGAMAQFVGSGAIAFAPYAVAAAGAETFAGTAALEASPFSVSGTGALRFSGSGAIALRALALDASGTYELIFSGSGAIELGRYAIASVGAQRFEGSVAVALAPYAVAAVAALRFEGSAAIALPGLEVAADGAYTPQSIIGTGAIVLESYSLEAAGAYSPPPITGTGAITLGSFALDGVGFRLVGSIPTTPAEARVLVRVEGYAVALVPTPAIIRSSPARKATAARLPAALPVGTGTVLVRRRATVRVIG